MKTILQTLTTAYEKIQDPVNWTQGAFARDLRGQDVMPLSPKATCWCALGAIRSQFNTCTLNSSEFLIRGESIYLLSYVAMSLNTPHGIASINDGALYGDAHANVLAIYEEAILHARNAGV